MSKNTLIEIGKFSTRKDKWSKKNSLYHLMKFILISILNYDITLETYDDILL